MLVWSLGNLVLQENHFISLWGKKNQENLNFNLINLLGQSSIPTLNRNGYSMFWLSSWENLHSYSTNLNEDAFIRNIFQYMVNDKYSSRFFFKKDSLFRFADSTSNTFLKSLNHSELSEFFFRFKKIPYYISKIRILKFQKWIIAYFYIYNYRKKVSNSSSFSNFFNFFKFQQKNSFFFFAKKSNFCSNF
jgi:hypothetical protein